MNPRTSMKVAVVDDHEPLRKQLAEYVKSSGFTLLFAAANGEDCLRNLKEAEALPDVCVMDMMMPVMDGFQATALVKQLWPGVRIIGYSLNKDRGTAERAIRCGADLFLSKESEPEELLSAIDALAGNRNSGTMMH